MSHRVTLRWSDGRIERLAVPPDRTILGAAEGEGIALPFGCRTGACATCTGRLLEGDVDHRRPTRALQDRHRRDDYVLLCVAEPRSDCRIAVGSEVRTELHDNPWK